MKNDEKPNLSDIVDCLVEETYNILKWRIIASKNIIVRDEEEAHALGLPSGWFSYDHKELNKIVDMVKPMLKDAQSTRKIEAQTALEVVQLMQKGKVSISDAMSLMTLIKAKVEVQEKEKHAEIQDSLFNLLKD